MTIVKQRCSSVVHCEKGRDVFVDEKIGVYKGMEFILPKEISDITGVLG